MLTIRQKEISDLQGQLIIYVKNLKVFDKYKKGGYNKNFKEKNIIGMFIIILGIHEIHLGIQSYYKILKE